MGAATMMVTATVLLAITVLGGLVLAILRFQSGERPRSSIAMLHELLAGSALTNGATLLTDGGLPTNHKWTSILVLPALTTLLGVGSATAMADAVAPESEDSPHRSEDAVDAQADRTLREGRQTFRFDTFGDEAFWTDTIKLNRAIEGQRFGGVGPGVSPKTALAVGLKVDVDALPEGLIDSLLRGRADLNDPATTLALLQLNAIVGVTGHLGPDGSLRSLGINCALCHSTVDNSLTSGIGHRLDGWANRDLNIGAVINLAPDLSAIAMLLGVNEPTVRTVVTSWGPGKFDAGLLLDGKGFRPDGKTAATLIPPAFGLAGVNLHTSTGWGSVPYWNAFVAILAMHGKGTFFDPRLNDAVKFPVAARAGFADVRDIPDLVSSKLPALQAYQLAIRAPAAPRGSFDSAAARRGEELFENTARCSTCHIPPTFTEPGWNMHTAAEIGVDDFQANRSPDQRYRTAPLKGLWTHTKGGFYHDGRFATLQEVVDHYNTLMGLSLSEQDKRDLIEYLKSL